MSATDYVIAAAIGIASILVLSIGLSWVFARLYGRPTRVLPAETPTDYGLPFVPVTFASKGVPLDGWFIGADPAGVDSPPTIIMTHGWSRNKARMLPLAALLHEAGFGLLLFDARGHGASGSDGAITVLKFAEDIVSAVGFLEGHPGVDPTRVGVVGHSIGGAAAIVAASMEPKIQAVVTSSAFADPASLTRRFMRTFHLPRGPFFWLVCRIIDYYLGTTMTDIAPQNRISRVEVPVLLVHGEDDRMVPVSDLEAIYARAQPQRTHRMVLAGRGHSDVITDPRYGPAVIEFLQASLCAPRPG